jgi:hypothetical protein
MIATAQAGDWQGRVEELRTQKDRKDDRGQYCARHAAMLRKAKEKEQKNGEQFLEAKKLSISTANVSIS